MANKFINELNPIESVAVGDELPIWDSSESDTRKTPVSKLSSAITVNLVSEGISAPPSSNAVAIAIQNANAVLHVETLPASSDIKNVIYHNTIDGKYYVGNKTTQTTSELNTDSVRYVQTLPVSPNIENLIYAVESLSGKYKFYAGDKENQTTQELGGSGAIFTGTQAEWDALTTAEKNEYSRANITDTSSTVFIPVDTVADGNMNPVTSNAVYDALTPVDITSSISPIANKAEWDIIGGPENKVYRIGNLVIVNIRFNTLTTASYEAVISGFPIAKGTNKIVNFNYTRDTGSGCENGIGYIDGAGDLKFRFGTTHTGNYQTFVNFSYIAEWE